MEKQPVDDLFARKLRETQVEVNPDAFARIQQRIGVNEIPPKKVDPIWWYAAAACFLGVMAVGYVVSSNENVTNVHEDHIANHRRKPLQTRGKENEGKQETAYLIEKEGLGTKDMPSSVEARYVSTPQSKGANATGKPVALSDEEQLEQIPADIDLDQQEISLAKLKPVIAEPPLQVLSVQKPTTDRTVVLTISEPQPIANRTDGGASGDLDNTKPHGFSGLLDKLRQLKNGETFARATANSGKSTTPLGRTLTELKESLKNETTID